MKTFLMVIGLVLCLLGLGLLGSKSLPLPVEVQGLITTAVVVCLLWTLVLAATRHK
jgi:hypothetical protein